MHTNFYFLFHCILSCCFPSHRLPSLARRIMGERRKQFNVLRARGHCIVFNPSKLQTSSLTRATAWCKWRLQSRPRGELKLCKVWCETIYSKRNVIPVLQKPIASGWFSIIFLSYTTVWWFPGFMRCTQGNVEYVVEPGGLDNWHWYQPAALYSVMKYKKGSP